VTNFDDHTPKVEVWERAHYEVVKITLGRNFVVLMRGRPIWIPPFDMDEHYVGDEDIMSGLECVIPHKYFSYI
jgi:hypothetical protein